MEKSSSQKICRLNYKVKQFVTQATGLNITTLYTDTLIIIEGLSLSQMIFTQHKYIMYLK